MPSPFPQYNRDSKSHAQALPFSSARHGCILHFSARQRPTGVCFHWLPTDSQYHKLLGKRSTGQFVFTISRCFMHKSVDDVACQKSLIYSFFMFFYGLLSKHISFKSLTHTGTFARFSGLFGTKISRHRMASTKESCQHRQGFWHNTWIPEAKGHGTCCCYVLFHRDLLAKDIYIRGLL